MNALLNLANFGSDVKFALKIMFKILKIDDPLPACLKQLQIVVY